MDSMVANLFSVQPYHKFLVVHAVVGRFATVRFV